MPVRTISSQRFLDDEIVEAKRKLCDFVVSYVNLEVEGEQFRVVVDGHHSLAAAMASRVAPEWVHASTVQQDVDALGALGWLEAHQHDTDWYDVGTGHNVW